MLHILLRVLFWSTAYLLAALLPLGVALVGDTPHGRGFLIELGVALGMVGFAMLGIQFVTTSRFRWIAPYFGTDAQIQFHRETGILATAFVLAHPILLLSADRRYLEFLDPTVNLPRAVFLSIATAALVLLVVLPLWRLSFRLSYEWWRLTHGGLALVVILIGLTHVLQVGHYVAGLGKQAAWVGGTAVVVGLLIQTRVVKPWMMRRKPWRVVEVRPDCPNVYRLVVEPVGHEGLPFEAGQYAWITLGDSPFALQQHPFSFASSAEVPGRVEFGIKELGDFTASIKDVAPGTTVFLEGPYGSFHLVPHVDGAAFIVGGIGVTPVLSMLQTCRDRKDRRPLLLIYANGNREEIAFQNELDALQADLDLKIVHVLNEPPDDWQGETGFVTPEILDRHLPATDAKDLQYFVCGPPAMMDAVERALTARGVMHRRLASERFDMV